MDGTNDQQKKDDGNLQQTHQRGDFQGTSNTEECDHSSKSDRRDSDASEESTASKGICNQNSHGIQNMECAESMGNTERQVLDSDRKLKEERSTAGAKINSKGLSEKASTDIFYSPKRQTSCLKERTCSTEGKGSLSKISRTTTRKKSQRTETTQADLSSVRSSNLEGFNKDLCSEICAKGNLDSPPATDSDRGQCCKSKSTVTSTKTTAVSSLQRNRYRWPELSSLLQREFGYEIPKRSEQQCVMEQSCISRAENLEPKLAIESLCLAMVEVLKLLKSFSSQQCLHRTKSNGSRGPRTSAHKHTKGQSQPQPDIQVVSDYVQSRQTAQPELIDTEVKFDTDLSEPAESHTQMKLTQNEDSSLKQSKKVNRCSPEPGTSATQLLQSKDLAQSRCDTHPDNSLQSKSTPHTQPAQSGQTSTSQHEGPVESSSAVHYQPSSLQQMAQQQNLPPHQAPQQHSSAVQYEQGLPEHQLPQEGPPAHCEHRPAH